MLALPGPITGAILESVPFAARSRPEGATLFTTLTPERTGIQSMNAYSDPRMWTDRYKVFVLGPIGTGVAIADYDGDGRPDVYVANKCAPNRLFRNLGDWRFEDVTDQAGVGGPVDAWKGGVAFADVNNDGHPDLYVCRWNAPNLLYRNRGDGTFVEEAQAAGLAVADASGMGAFCDYDRDGWLDLLLQTNFRDVANPDGQRDRLFRNRGDGTFEEVTANSGLYGETHGHSATWWDYDADGWPDLYLANDFSPPDQLFRNQGDGTFADVLKTVLPHAPIYAMGADLGDLDNDGRMDLLVGDMLPTDAERDRRTMLELRERFPEMPRRDWPAQAQRNALYLSTGTAHFQEAAYLAGLAATDWTWSLRCEDLDNDGWLDVHVTNGMVRDLFDNDRTPQLANFSSLEQARAVKAWPILKEKNLAYRNQGDLQFSPVGTEWGLDHAGVSFGAAFGDLDGDGDLDLVFANYEGHPTVCRNDGENGHAVTLALRGTNSNRYGVGAWVSIETASGRQVRQLVLARGYMSTSEPAVHFGLGEADSVARLMIHWPSGIVQSFENLAADRHYTVTEAGRRIEMCGATDGAGSGLFTEVSASLGLTLASIEPAVDELKTQPLLSLRQNAVGPSLAVADLDGDGRDDLVQGGASGEAALLTLRRAGGGFDPPRGSSRQPSAADAGVVTLDANGDGRLDLFFAKGGVAFSAENDAYRPRLLLARGGMRFQRAPGDALPAFTGSVGPVVAADFDRDGRMDLFLGGRVVPDAYAVSPRSVLWINRGSRFSDETRAWASGLEFAGMISGAIASDVDQDGWIDLILAPHWGTVQYWHNQQGRGFEDWSQRAGFTGAGSGWWNSIAAGDFNGDGRLDYAVGNLGMNTAYRATPTEPAVLYRGTFEGNPSPQLLEASVKNSREYPRRGRSRLLHVFSGLARKVPTFAGYGEATLEKMFGAPALRGATRLEATEFRSGILMSSPDGRFHFQPLPRRAQISPAMGIVASDLDGDGKTDLCLVQNSSSPVPQVGRFDGGVGQFLRGDGRGGFVAWSPRESGISVPGDGKALAILDADEDSRPDLVVTVTGEQTLLFRNQGRADGSRFFSVELDGPAGNPTGIGARITVEAQDGSTQVAEVHAGSGYLSQSSARLFFGYPADNPPRTIRVFWPGEKMSTLPWHRDAKRIQVTVPGAEHGAAYSLR